MKLLKAGIGILSCVALALALARCSPLVSSISKVTQKAPQTVQELPLFLYNTQVLDGEAYEEALSGRSSNVVKLELSEEQLLQFKKNGEIELELEKGILPEEGESLLAVAFSSSEIADFGLYKFKTVLRRKADGVWALSIKPGLDSDVISNVRENLVGIAVALSVKPKAGKR